MTSIEIEYNTINDKISWNHLYRMLESESDKNLFTCSAAKKPCNLVLNRYRNVSPYDHSRIKLKRIPNDYINANLVQRPHANRKYILTQGPLMSTCSHFWLMMWEQKSRAIVMLNKVVEKNESKCYMYWPNGIGEEHKIDLMDVQLTVEMLAEDVLYFFTVREFRIYDLVSKTYNYVKQFHYTTWPDFGVPTSPSAFLEFLRVVRKSGAFDEQCGPPIVHCSAGIGRSGTFCLVDACLAIVENEGSANLNVKDTLLGMRKDRMGLIQTASQLQFAYLSIIEGIKLLNPSTAKKLKSESEESIYESVAEDEPPSPPARQESLYWRPPDRLLPPIPYSQSEGELRLCEDESSSSDEGSSPSASSTLLSHVQSSCSSALPVFAISTETTQITKKCNNDPGVSLEKTDKFANVRQRIKIAEQIKEMKKHAREPDRWQRLKQTLCKPFSITVVGFIVATIVIYAYARR